MQLKHYFYTLWCVVVFLVLFFCFFSIPILIIFKIPSTGKYQYRPIKIYSQLVVKIISRNLKSTESKSRNIGIAIIAMITGITKDLFNVFVSLTKLNDVKSLFFWAFHNIGITYITKTKIGTIIILEETSILSLNIVYLVLSSMSEV